MSKKEDKRLHDFLCYEVDDRFQDIFSEFIYELSQVDLSEKTLDNLYQLFIKDMKMYFERRKS